MKSEYVRPTIVELDIVADGMIASSLEPIIFVGDDVDTSTTDGRGRRGTWGNLWE